MPQHDDGAEAPRRGNRLAGETSPYLRQHAHNPVDWYDSRLLGELPRLPWKTVLEVYLAVLDRPDVTPGMVGAIHTFGELVHWY